MRTTTRPAEPRDLPGFLGLAGQVEQWFGPMVTDPGFRAAVEKNIRRGTALVAVTPDGAGPLGALLFGAKPPMYHVHWLVVAEGVRGRGIGRALLADALHRFVRPPGTVEVVTLGEDHPGARESGARVFYERLGFIPGDPEPPGPEGGSRQRYRLAL
ncbi:GNAT family N-acetyltransferase [Streptomyces orinoci]|uniref:GNAT family N-acetyltransferase n=1 Tax=Streptomyces orinoci TaxID=67339 RepID=A0ABV3JRR6_STRON|nr:GNAT family N-acetyltransferase [Streptomyces orinoci]